jgi:hypothetical protein
MKNVSCPWRRSYQSDLLRLTSLTQNGRAAPIRSFEKLTGEFYSITKRKGIVDGDWWRKGDRILWKK